MPAQSGKVFLENLTGGTCTSTNLSNFDFDGLTPVSNIPKTANLFLMGASWVKVDPMNERSMCATDHPEPVD